MEVCEDLLLGLSMILHHRQFWNKMLNPNKKLYFVKYVITNWSPVITEYWSLKTEHWPLETLQLMLQQDTHHNPIF
jgi:hypothetical protein